MLEILEKKVDDPIEYYKYDQFDSLRASSEVSDSGKMGSFKQSRRSGKGSTVSLDMDEAEVTYKKNTLDY